MAKKITERVTWVGKTDWELDLRRGAHAPLARHDVHLSER